MWQKSKAVLLALLVGISISTLISGCSVSASRVTLNAKADPFFTDRIATVRILMKEKDRESLRANAFAEQYVPADFWFDGELIPKVGIRPKGNASLGQTVGWGSPRLPLTVDFNLFNRGRTFRGLKKISLNNGWSDPTLLRDVISYEIFAKMDIPSPRASLVDVWVNDQHLGVYTMAEAVDQTFLRRHFAIASGNLYKPEVIAARLDWTEKDAYKNFVIPGMKEQPRQNPALYTNLGGGPLIDILRALGQEETVAAYKPIPPAQGNIFRGLPPMAMPRNYLEAMALKTNENNPDYSALFRFLDVLNNEPDETFPGEIEKVLDVDETLRFLAVSGAILHLDNYIGIGHNTYLYEVNGRFSIIPWDLNMTFGTFNNGIRKEGLINFYIDEPVAGPVNRYPLVKRLLAYQPYLDKYHGYLKQLLDGPFALDTVLARIDQLAEMVRPCAAADKEMFYSYEDWERCLTEDLRPPDSFEGWMAGGASPMLPFFLSSQETAGLRSSFGVNSLYELVMRDFKPGELETVKSILSAEHYNVFLENIFGPLKAPQPPRQPGFGPNCLGLKSFIAKRYESLRQQLNGERPSKSGYGSGNGGSLWLVDWMNITPRK
jgi:hypothetical protein